MVSGPLAKFSRIHSHNQLTTLAYRFSTLTKWENDSGDNRGVCHFVLHWTTLPLAQKRISYS